MAVLVTGATGMLGSHVVRAPLASSEEPVALSSRGDPRLLGPLRREVQLERCDIRDSERVGALMVCERVDTVIHLAALMPGVCRERPAEAVEVNVTATAGLYAAANRAGIRRFVYASSKSAYGPELPAEHGPPEYRPIPETLPARQVWMYDVTKRAGEQVIEARRRVGGPEATSLRFATIYGPGKGARYGGASVLSALIETASCGPRCSTARIDIGPGLHYMGEEPTYGVLDVTLAREDLGLAIDADPVRGARLLERGLAELRSG